MTAAQARLLWLRAQGLHQSNPFGQGPAATSRTVEHLGYVQIDTINVIQRSHHHILRTRISDYSPIDLERAQSVDKSVFEYWTHALAYVPSADYRYFMPAMARHRETLQDAFASVSPDGYAALLKRVRQEGPISLRDIDEQLVEKDHPWGSRKPSKRALRLGFFVGDLVVSKRSGMLKSYELTLRHFGWRRRPKPVTGEQLARYVLERALRTQGVVSLESICFGNAALKKAVAERIEFEVSRKRLLPVRIAHHAVPHWADAASLDSLHLLEHNSLTHILSPFDPLVIQRKRLEMLFGYRHRFEAYVPAAKRVLGYFALPILVGDEVVAAIDLKADRPARKLLIQQWTWMVTPRVELKAAIEAALDRFERFQMA
jgi:hypothetical protein